MPRERKTEIPASVQTIGSNIKRIITDRGLKTRHIAERADIDIETFRKYLSGKNQIMGIDKLVRIAKALELEDYNDLFRDV